MKSEPIITQDGLLKRCGDTVVSIPNLALSEPVPITVVGDFTKTHNVHLVTAFRWTPVRNIYGAETGELLFLFGDGVVLKRGGNIETRYRVRPERNILLYYNGSMWLVVSKT